MALHWKILIGLVIGVVAGGAARALLPSEPDGTPNGGLMWFARNIAEPVGQVFMRLIFMVVLPLVFCALALGVAELGDVRRLGRVGLRTLGFTLVMSAASVGIGLALVNTIRPGTHLTDEQRAVLRERYVKEAEPTLAHAQKAKSVRDTLLDIIPKNPLQEMVGALDGSSRGGGMLAVMFFAMMFGMALTLVPERTGPVIAVLQGVYDAVLAIVALAMKLAPIGVAGLMFALTATVGLDILRSLLWFMITALSGLALHFVVVFSLVVYFFGGMSPWRFFSRSSDAILTGLATSSSSATLPTSLKVTEEKLGVRREISNFVLTVGSTANQNGTALYEGVTVLFLAQVFGVELTIAQQVYVVVLSVLAGVGTAGVPGGSLPMIVLILQAVGVPGEGIGIIVGVDRLLDMCRTVLNVVGDMVVAVCVDRAERRGTVAVR